MKEYSGIVPELGVILVGGRKDSATYIENKKIACEAVGISPLNIGLLATLDREPLFVPCTPKGCIELLHRYGVSIEGKRAVVIGRSNIVGLPAALLLQREYATVTVVQPGTKNPEEVTREADILISAVSAKHG